MFTKLVRITRDSEMKYLQTGTAVLEIGAVYDVGFGDKKKPQFLDKLKSLLVVIVDKNQKVMTIIKILSLLVLAEGRDYNLEVKRLTLLLRKKLMYLFSMMGQLSNILRNLRVLNLKNKIYKL